MTLQWRISKTLCKPCIAAIAGLSIKIRPRSYKTIVGILTFMSRKNSLLGSSEPNNATFLNILYLLAFIISCSAELSMEKVLYPRRQTSSVKNENCRNCKECTESHFVWIYKRLPSSIFFKKFYMWYTVELQWLEHWWLDYHKGW